MKLICTLAVFFMIFALGALSHESDILRACSENGESGMTTWLGDIDCSPKNTLEGRSRVAPDEDSQG